MKIAISMNGIVRDLLTKVKVVHEKYYESKIKGSLTEKNILKKLDFEDEDMLLDFLFEEAPMEIYGHSKEKSPNFIRGLNELSLRRNDLIITLISDEVGRAIPATYWFLAKFGSQTKNVRFIKQKEKKKIWEDFDVIITNDEKIIKHKPDNKILVSNRSFKLVDVKFKKIKDILNLDILVSDEKK
jgi:hypothetical protein